MPRTSPNSCGCGIWATNIRNSTRNCKLDPGRWKRRFTGGRNQIQEFTDSLQRAYERLAQSEELFRQLVQGVKEYAIFMLDVEGHIKTWTPAAQRIKGYDAQEIIGQHFSRFYLPEDIARGKPARAQNRPGTGPV